MAQDQPANTQQAATSSSTTPPGIAPGEIVVTAQRRAEALSKVPVSVSAFNTQALQERKINSEADLNSLVPGLNVTVGENASEFDFTIRGQTTDAFSGSPPGVLAYLNEVAISPHSETSTSFYDLASVQVLKGPQGTLFGRNDTGGAVLYTTAQPRTDKVEGYFTGDLGNFAYREAQGAINVPLVKDVLAVRVAGDITTRNGYVDNIFDGKRLGDQNHKSIRATILFKPTSRLTNTLFADYRHIHDTSQNGEIFSAYAVGETNNGFPLTALAAEFYGSAVADAVADQRARGFYKADIWFTPRLNGHGLSVINTTAYDLGSATVKNIFGYSKSFTNEQADLAGGPFGAISLINLNDPTQGNHIWQKTLSDEFQIQGTAGNLKYIAGAYYSHNTEKIVSPVVVGATLPTPVAAFGYNNRYSDLSRAVFAQGTYDLSDLTGLRGLGFTAGIRYTWEKITLSQIEGSAFLGSPEQLTRESKPSWQVGLQEQLNPQLLLYFVTRGSWRAGGFNGTAAPGPTTNTFGPETTHDFEIGAKFAGRAFSMPAHLNIALYDQIVDNAERDIYADVAGHVASLTENIPQATVKGVEADGDIRPIPLLELGFQFAYTHAVWSKPDVVLPGGTSSAASSYENAPKLSGAIFGRIDLPVQEWAGKMWIRADYYAQSHFFFSNFYDTLSPRTRLPHYSLLNLRYQWDLPHNGVSVALWAKNVTDKRYLVGGTAFGPSSGANVAFPGTPRTVGVELGYKF
ncbi:TonB-dependent receptor [Sphingomonas sp. CGMCC 1.13654]|uniref:TonB-dependent receptor n=1 Tax=Sphingomonas chungangi TaxID=2683589 RepID=A0A838L7Z0_9SPHN|nr:TonB-dependent receptor [Sphingomonas chungangi]MBA2935294.1 TonB-dependent receptor [Sphingomonas chungangi]